MSWDFRGASFDRSAFGPNAHVDARNSSSGNSTTLKVELASLRGNLQAQPDSRVFVMYGQTEATSRLSYLPPELLPTKLGSIGRGIPGVTLTVALMGSMRAWVSQGRWYSAVTSRDSPIQSAPSLFSETSSPGCARRWRATASWLAVLTCAYVP